MKCNSIYKRTRATGLALSLAALGLSAPLAQAWAVECGAILDADSFSLDQDVELRTGARRRQPGR